MGTDRLSLRPAEADDCQRIFDWANDDHARAMSFHSNPIEWEQHLLWYVDKLADPDCLFFVLMHKRKPVGLIRFDASEISVTIDRSSRGKGFATEGIKMAVEICSLDAVHARIKPENEASLHAFRNAGFSEDGAQGTPEALRLVWRRSAV